MSIEYLFIDMNSYFASVEQQLRPELRGQPIAIVPVMSENTACIAASYEAKRFGIGSVAPVRDALRLCPDLQLVVARPKVYVEMHHRIVEAVETCLPIDAILSIDEMICKLIGDERPLPKARSLGKQIKEAIAGRVGHYLKCSIGLAPNRLLAKVAADMQKPDGLTAIEKQELPQRLHPLKLTDFPGIGPRMERRLNVAGIATVEQLCRLSIDELSTAWGSRLLGESWWNKLRGEDLPEAHTHRRSLSHSQVLSPDLRNEDSAKAVLMRLVDKCAARMRHSGYWTGSLSLAVRYVNGPRWDERRKLSLTQASPCLLKTCLDMWKQKPRGTPMKISIVLGDLVHDRNAVRSLFEEDQHQSDLSRTLDKIREQFGTHSLYFADTRPALSDHNPIAFNHIPNLQVPGV